jgi:hypothetical protein
LGSLQHFGARWYSPTLGRFLSPDSLGPRPGDPRDLDRYGYVRGNPIKHTDPTGHQAILGSLASAGPAAGAAGPLGLAVALAVTVKEATGAEFSPKTAADNAKRWVDYAFGTSFSERSQSDADGGSGRHPGYLGGKEGVEEKLAGLPLPPEGPTVARDSATAERLARIGMSGSYLDTPGEPGVVSLYPDAEIGEVVHEITHWEQARARGYVDTPAAGSAEYWREELRARQAELDQVGHLYPTASREHTEREIERIRGLLKELGE